MTRPLIPLSEALLEDASIRARFLGDATMGKPRPGSLQWLRSQLAAIEDAVRADERERMLGPLPRPTPPVTVEALAKWVRHLGEYRHQAAGNHEPGPIEGCRDSECHAILAVLAAGEAEG